MASNNPEQREEEETDADKDEDTGAQVAPIVRTKTVVVTTGEEDEDTILDLYFLSIYYLLIDLLEISQTLTLLYTSAQKKLNEDLAKDDSDSKAMKRPPSAFFVFTGEFRNLFKQNFPENKSVAAQICALKMWSQEFSCAPSA